MVIHGMSQTIIHPLLTTHIPCFLTWFTTEFQIPHSGNICQKSSDTHTPQYNIRYHPLCNLKGRTLVKILEITVTGTRRMLLPKIPITCYGVSLIPTLWQDEWLRVFCILLGVTGRCGLLLYCKYEASFTKVTVTNGGCLPAIHMRCYGNSPPEIDYQQRKHPTQSVAAPLDTLQARPNIDWKPQKC